LRKAKAQTNHGEIEKRLIQQVVLCQLLLAWNNARGNIARGIPWKVRRLAETANFSSSSHHNLNLIHFPLNPANQYSKNTSSRAIKAKNLSTNLHRASAIASSHNSLGDSPTPLKCSC
jgi:hypothetical protein